jgi:hypothetical protein
VEETRAARSLLLRAAVAMKESICKGWTALAAWPI